MVFSTSKNILITLPDTKEGLGYQRLIHWEKNYQNDLWYFERSMIYSRYVLDKVTNAQWFVINSSKLFSSHIADIIIQLNQELNLDINIDQAVLLHKKWLDKIENYVAQKIRNAGN